MGIVLPRRALYRARQFYLALWGARAPLSEGEQAEARTWLPEAGWALFSSMPRPDQRHGLSVLRQLMAAGQREPALLQAALLHDCAKRGGAIRLRHRVAVVLLKAMWPRRLARWGAGQPPPRNDWRYPFWLHANHPAASARLAAGAGCDPRAVWLIEHHQDQGPADALLAALRSADDDN